MWYAIRENGKTRICFSDGASVLCEAGTVRGDRVATLEKGRCVIREISGRVLYRNPFVSERTRRIAPYGDGFIAFDEDTGCLYELTSRGALVTIQKAGEHISDLSVQNTIAYVASYHDNKILVYDSFRLVREQTYPGVPVRLCANETNVFVLMQNEYATAIVKLNRLLEEEKRITLARQYGNLSWQDNRLFFGGNEQRMILRDDLSVVNNQKSTGEILCRDASEAVFYRNRAYRCDPVNGILYPV